eukprot:211919-Hanusia_phi.AAC.1
MMFTTIYELVSPGPGRAVIGHGGLPGGRGAWGLRECIPDRGESEGNFPARLFESCQAQRQFKFRSSPIRGWHLPARGLFPKFKRQLPGFTGLSYSDPAAARDARGLLHNFGGRGLYCLLQARLAARLPSSLSDSGNSNLSGHLSGLGPE